jgi:hypothetical protein
MHSNGIRVIGLTAFLVLIPGANVGADLSASCKNAKAKATGKKARASYCRPLRRT